MKNRSIIYGANAWYQVIILWLHIGLLSLKYYKNPFTALRIFKIQITRKNKIEGTPGYCKIVKMGKRFAWSCDYPSWPSEVFDEYTQREFIRTENKDKDKILLQTVIFGITNRCPLRCSHCYEWNNLDSKDHLSLNDLKSIMSKLSEVGLYHIQLSGGEPLARFDDLVELISTSDKRTEFWILTSGFGLNSEKARKLKEAGLTGANISLDHWEEKRHNDFRNNEESFFWVKEAVKNCRNSKISVSLSLCATKEFISEQNLNKYYDLAKETGADFVRILEPRRTGRYAGSDVLLKKEHYNILDEFYTKAITDRKYRTYPVIVYPGYHQRRAGCFGAGNRYFYIDSNAETHACPFCLNSKGNALKEPLETLLTKLKTQGCHAFCNNSGD